MFFVIWSCKMKKILLAIVPVFFITFNSGFCNIKSAYIATRPEDPRKILVLATDFLDEYPERFKTVNHVLHCVKSLNVPTSVFYSSLYSKSDSFGNAVELPVTNLFLHRDKDFFNEGDIIADFTTRDSIAFKRSSPRFLFYNLASCQLLSIITGALKVLSDEAEDTEIDAPRVRNYLNFQGLPADLHHNFWLAINDICCDTCWAELVVPPCVMLEKISFYEGLVLPDYEEKIVNRLKYYSTLLRQDLLLIANFSEIIKNMFGLSTILDLESISLKKIYQKNPAFFSNMQSDVRIHSKTVKHKLFEEMLNAKFLCHLLQDKSFVKVVFICCTQAKCIKTDLKMSGYRIYNARLNNFYKLESLKQIIKSLV